MERQRSKRDEGRPVLVVDDEPSIRELLTAILADHGCRVRTAPDGLAALAAVGDEPPDMALSDVPCRDWAGTGC
jgi:CheY-like chemotaxis protein